MATRISVTPDKDGLIHITCGDADLELDVSSQPGGSTASAGPLPSDPGAGPILSLVGPSWSGADSVELPPKGHPLMVHAHVIDVHALDALIKRLPNEGLRPGVAPIHIDLRR